MINTYFDSLSLFVTAALLIAAIVLTWVACDWIAENWRRGIGVIGRWLLRREYARMAREHEAARRAVAQSSLTSTANNPRTVARNYRVRAGEFYGTTRISLVAEPGISGEQDED